jgi:hypothetical protein
MLSHGRAPEHLTEEIDRKIAAIKIKWNRATLCGHKQAAKALQDDYECMVWERDGLITMHYGNQYPRSYYGTSTWGLI